MTAALSTELAARVPVLHRMLVARPGSAPNRDEVARLVRQQLPLLGAAEVHQLTAVLEEHLHGLGPLDAILDDPSITEVMINGPGPVWIERRGVVHRTDVELDETTIRLVIDRVIGPLGLRLDRAAPFVDARLDEGSRVHITIPPMAIDGPYVTIRRFPERGLPLAAFASPPVAELLAGAVRGHKTMLVTGATGAGKTSLLNALGASIGEGERVVTIEDSAELRLPGRHVVRLEARPPNAEGIGEITMRTLVRNALRMRPDRLVVGEVRGAEAFEMLQALTTGHAGSLSTVHANSPLEALDRLSAMVLMADVALAESLVRRMLEAAFDLVVHVVRDSDGARSVRDIASCTPGRVELLGEGGRVRCTPES